MAMFERVRNPWLLGGLALLLLSAACVQLAPRVLSRASLLPGGDDPLASETTAAGPATGTEPAPEATRGPGAGRQIVAVARGSVSETTTVLGVIAGADEEAIPFLGTGKVQTVNVKSGDAVDEGQVLLQTESDAIQKQLVSAQAELETSRVRLEQARAQAAADAQSRQLEASRRAQDEAMRRQAAVGDAQLALRNAQAELARVQAGAAPSELRTAEAAVNAARQLTQKAEADQVRLAGGSDADQVRGAARDVANAQTGVDQAQADVDRLTRGPDPDLVRAAERDVARAQNGVKVAEAIKVDPKDDQARVDREAAIAAARLDVQAAQDRLARLQQPPNPADVTVARGKLQVAQAALESARARAEALRQGPDQATVDQAAAAADSARLTQQAAEERLAELSNRPTPEELQAAQDKVTVAQAALNRALAEPAPAPSSADPGTSYNQVLLEKDLARNQALVDSLQKSLEATQLLAPFPGIVTSVEVHAGDTPDRGTPVLVLAHADQAVARVNVSPREAARLGVGQHGSLKLSGALDDAPVAATLTKLSDTSGSASGRVAEFSVAWSKTHPAFGSPVQLQVTTQQKDNVLVIPKKALHTAGSRRYVQVQDGVSRKTLNVEVGLVTEVGVEILSGLAEGQQVLVGP
jgi:multidrug resistance efflux pump